MFNHKAHITLQHIIVGKLYLRWVEVRPRITRAFFLPFLHMNRIRTPVRHRKIHRHVQWKHLPPVHCGHVVNLTHPIRALLRFHHVSKAKSRSGCTISNQRQSTLIYRTLRTGVIHAQPIPRSQVLKTIIVRRTILINTHPPQAVIRYHAWSAHTTTTCLQIQTEIILHPGVTIITKRYDISTHKHTISHRLRLRNQTTQTNIY